MSAGDSTNAPLIAPADRDLVRRLTAVLAFIFVFAAAFAFLDRLYSQKFLDITGEAKWIWAQHSMSAGEPVAFFATRDFDLPENRVFTQLKVLGDPEYTIYLNGSPIAGRYVGEDRTLDVYDISTLVKTGRNRLVIAVRSHQGAGGLIAALDLGPEVANWIVSDESWRIYRRWTPALLTADPARGWERPLIIGEPPDGRWNYLTQRREELSAAPGALIRPLRSFVLDGLVPTISTRSGVAVAGTEQKRATVFEFGPVQGSLRVTLAKPPETSRDVAVRFANHPDELGQAERISRHVVFAPGEMVVTIPETHDFNFAMLFDEGVGAVVVRR